MHEKKLSGGKIGQLVNSNFAEQNNACSLKQYRQATDLLITKEIIITKTKFNGNIDNANNLVLMTETLTPESSRYWPIADYSQAVMSLTN